MDKEDNNIPSNSPISFWRLLDAAYSLAIITTVIAFFAPLHWFAEIMTCMRQQFMLVLCLAALTALLRFKNKL